MKVGGGGYKKWKNVESVTLQKVPLKSHWCFQTFQCSFVYMYC